MAAINNLKDKIWKHTYLIPSVKLRSAPELYEKRNKEIICSGKYAIPKLRQKFHELLSGLQIVYMKYLLKLP